LNALYKSYKLYALYIWNNTKRTQTI
jgi:hypothetical protein